MRPNVGPLSDRKVMKRMRPPDLIDKKIESKRIAASRENQDELRWV